MFSFSFHHSITSLLWHRPGWTIRGGDVRIVVGALRAGEGCSVGCSSGAGPARILSIRFIPAALTADVSSRCSSYNALSAGVWLGSKSYRDGREFFLIGVMIRDFYIVGVIIRDFYIFFVGIGVAGSFSEGGHPFRPAKIQSFPATNFSCQGGAKFFNSVLPSYCAKLFCQTVLPICKYGRWMAEKHAKMKEKH